MMVSAGGQIATRVNGALLPMYTGQQVVLVGTVVRVDPSGSSLMVKASDGKMVKATLSSPLQDNVQGVVEVHGVAQGQQVMCQSLITFPQMDADSFGATLYDEAIKLMHAKSNPWKPEED